MTLLYHDVTKDLRGERLSTIRSAASASCIQRSGSLRLIGSDDGGLQVKHHDKIDVQVDISEPDGVPTCSSVVRQAPSRSNATLGLRTFKGDKTVAASWLLRKMGDPLELDKLLRFALTYSTQSTDGPAASPTLEMIRFHLQPLADIKTLFLRAWRSP